MEGIIKFGFVIFVKDEDASDDLIQIFRAEHGPNRYRLKVDRTLKPPYYELFTDYSSNGREMSTKLFATSSLEKLLFWLNFSAVWPVETFV